MNVFGLVFDPQFVVLTRLLATLLFALVALLVVRELLLQQAAHRVIHELDTFLRALERKHSLCLGVSCYRFGVLPKDLEILFYEAGLKLNRVRARISKIARMAMVLPRSRAALLSQCNTYLHDLGRVERDLDAVGRFHARDLGWQPDNIFPEPWAALERANEEIVARTTGRGGLYGLGR